MVVNHKWTDVGPRNPAETGRPNKNKISLVFRIPNLTANDDTNDHSKHAHPHHPAQWRGRDMGASQAKWTANSMIGEVRRHPRGLWTYVFAAGAGGGLVASIATCPLDVVKTKLQAQRAVPGQPSYQGIAGE